MSIAVQQRHVTPQSIRASGTIAFDTWCLGAYARNHGVHVYASKLLQHFRELAPQHGIELVPYVSRDVENDANLLPAAPGFCPRETALLRFSRLWRFGGACALAATQKLDLVFSPHCTTLYPAKLVPAVVTIHDVIPARMKWRSRKIQETLRFFTWAAARFSRAIMTVSQYSKNDLMELYRLPESKVSVIYNGYDRKVFNHLPPDFDRLSTLLHSLNISRPYILHHGAIKPNKNLRRLIRAYQLLIERNPNLDFELVLAGPLDSEFDEVLAAANDAGGRVIVTGALSIDDLSMLVKGATLAVFPSLYEGFCLPMIEAMACGVPTIAANSSCLPEISGGVLRYFNPQSVEEMSACMEDALENSDLRMELSRKGETRARQFDWHRCAEQTLAVLKQQLAGGE